MSDERTYTGEGREARIIDSQTGPFLREMVRLIRPSLVVECGTFPGTATAFLAEALRPEARMVTYERDLRLYPEMAERFVGDSRLTVVLGSPPSFTHAGLAFIDSGPTYENRVADVELWLATAGPGAVAVIDDVAEAWFDPYRAHPGLHLASDHGLALWQRP